MHSPLRSLYFQILLFFLLIILFTLTVGTIIEYRSYRAELPHLITEIRTREISRQLSSAYTRDNSWLNIEQEIRRITNLERLNTSEDANLRIIVRNNDNKTVFNSFMNITELETVELIEGESNPVIDFSNGETIGIVTVYISRTYVDNHARSYISKLLKSGTYQALITALAAFLLSLVFSRSISVPVVRLTNAAQSIAEGNEEIKLPAGSSKEMASLSRAFAAMLKTLKTQRKLRKRLLSDVSHQINTPLNSIRLEARALSDGIVSSDEACRNIISEVDALKNIIYDLDWIAETDSGAYRLKLESCRITDLVTAEADRWVHAAETKSQQIVLDEFSEVHVEMCVDSAKISTVLGNLLDNAVKYSPPGSRITINSSIAKGFLSISVCDDGPAIPEKHRAGIFSRYYRSESRNMDKPSGRGLGLAIAEQIVKLHGGSLLLDCGEETGNCFIIMLPL